MLLPLTTAEKWTENVKAHTEHTEANKQVKKNRANKQKCMEDLVWTGEKAARDVNMKKLCNTTKNRAGKYSKPERPVNNEDRKPMTEIREQRNRWVEYFEELFNRPAPPNSPDT
ncbi:unnamed protein product [Schistosoma curassoni]|uniref:Reverse transcriptase domain-containing protein n=1 Tax=Schistosoma curassoni TaxID=6186 RepID=A0A183KPL0_9TREM|nr:unnamed protein product [Schistosoma curassoni]